MGRVDHWSKDYRSNSTKAHEIRAARHSLGKICARIYSRNENGRAASRLSAAQSGNTSDRKSRRASAPPNELGTEKLEKQNTSRVAVSGNVPLAEVRFLPELLSLSSARDN